MNAPIDKPLKTDQVTIGNVYEWRYCASGLISYSKFIIFMRLQLVSVSYLRNIAIYYYELVYDYMWNADTFSRLGKG